MQVITIEGNWVMNMPDLYRLLLTRVCYMFIYNYLEIKSVIKVT
jgi:hypothetical protein